jgi:methanogenic corrinoid protein MtbC1
MALIDSGWRVINLGPNTPLLSVATAMERLQPRLVWLSVSHLADTSQFIRDYRRLQQQASQQRVAIALGGQAMTAPLREQLVYTMFGDGITQLVQFASTLHPARPRPRRGRPRRTAG